MILYRSDEAEMELGCLMEGFGFVILHITYNGKVYAIVVCLYIQLWVNTMGFGIWIYT